MIALLLACAPEPKSAMEQMIELSAALDAKNPDLDVCWTERLAEAPDLAGTWTVRFTIEPEGTVSGTTVQGDTDDSVLEACLADRVGAWRFDRRAKPQKVKHPVTFPR